MTKDVIVNIKGSHFLEGEDKGPIEALMPGSYFKKEDSHYIFFEEYMEGLDEPLKTRIVIKNETVELTRSGSLKLRMYFDKSMESETDYDTPFGKINIKINTSSVDFKESEEELRCEIEYSLDFNDSPGSKSNMMIVLKPKGSVSL
ncbi:MAG: DUF1934 domain-containing protein [Lachnospiraceae bacterium]|nr:DUF1934 domain-containing protein [Lachnospiraceae bacterium]